MSTPASPQTESSEHHGLEDFALVRQTLSKLRFGNVVLTVHDGQLVQIDVTERRRFSLR